MMWPRGVHARLRMKGSQGLLPKHQHCECWAANMLGTFHSSKMAQNEAAVSPMRVTIDCGSDGREFYGRSSHRVKSSKINSRFDVDSFCKMIHGVIPKTVKDGRFILREPDMDQTGYSDTLVPMSASPPEGFIPKYAPRFKAPRLKVPKINVPELRAQVESPFSAPKVGSSMSFLPLRSFLDDSSAERMEKFKKGVQKMLHVVKVLGQIDQYLSERTRIVIDKLSKTFAD